MRVIETSLEEDLSLFSRYLWQQRVRHRIFEESGRQIVEVAEASAVEGVRSAYQAWRSGRLILSSTAAERPVGESMLARALALLQRFPLLAAVLLLAVAVYPFSESVSSGEIGPIAAALTIIDLRHADGSGLWALRAEPWRIITPIFLHFSLVHLLFNLAVVADFGRRVELGRGSVCLGLLIFAIGSASNAGQFLVSGNPLFGGLSGVAYGLLGFVLVSQRRFPGEIAWQVHPGFALSLVLFLVIFSTGVTEFFGLYVANTAHWIGLACGALLGLVVPRPTRER